MDDVVLAKIRKKASERTRSADDIRRLARSVGRGHEVDSVVLGIMAGRVYNSFYYQTRRVMGRDPTPGEFEEFLAVVCDVLCVGGDDGGDDGSSAAG